MEREARRVETVLACSWPAARAGEALEMLARRGGLVRGPLPARGEPTASPDGAAAGVVALAARRLGLETEAVRATHGEAGELLRSCGPALLTIPDPEGGEEPRLLAVLGCRRRRARVLTPQLTVRQVPVAEAAGWLTRELEEAASPRVERLLERLALAPRRRPKVRAALLAERLRKAPVREGWLLRLPPGSPFWRQLAHHRLGRLLVTFAACYALAYGLVLGSWWTLGRGALAGHLSHEWLWAWALLLLSSVLPRQWSGRAQARLAVGVGTLVKRRLLQGALELEPDEIRHQGAGQLLGRVIESESLQGYALIGGFLAVIGSLELAMASWVLARGAGGLMHAALLVLWMAALALAGWRFAVHRWRWTDDRMELTDELVESLVGHRTRLAQERRERWHLREDRLLEGYLASSRAMDRRRVVLGVTAFGWVAVGAAGLLPAFVAGASQTALAIAVGGVLLAAAAFDKLCRGGVALIGAAISWRQAGPILRAAARSLERPPAETAALALGWEESSQRALLTAENLVFRHPDRPRPVLDGCSFEIREGDRILIEGPSGGGKSTLAGILTHLRVPSSGLMLLGGLDRHTLGRETWRRHVVAAPQFHENHVFTETFAFNLLMGRGWPPAPGDLAEATEICRELGLGELLRRMPAGLLQLVGETGWQLSHGERSRLFVARALLQASQVVILDESFAALDPENLQRALQCALRRAPTLLVIAHP